MDRDVTVRFYEIHQVDGGGRAFEEVIRDVAALQKVEREKDVSGPITLRLEHLEERDGLLLGDLTRVQTENLPGHVTDAGNDRLPVDRIGHPAAFCYDPVARAIALQFDLKIGIGRVCNYFAQFEDAGDFGHMPVLRADAMERFEDETPTALTVRVARRRNFENAETPLTDFERQIETMGAMFDAPSVEVTISCRGADGGINKGRAIETVRRWLGFRDEIEGISKVRGATLESDDAYNFIKFLLKESETLDLPANDPADGRVKRIRYLRKTYAEHRSYLRAAATG
jgi:hypothetical protein